MSHEGYSDGVDFHNELEFIRSRWMSTRERDRWLDRNQQTIEGNMAQREDRLPKTHNIKLEIDITEQLTGKSKERWIERWGSRRIIKKSIL